MWELIKGLAQCKLSSSANPEFKISKEASPTDKRAYAVFRNAETAFCDIMAGKIFNGKAIEIDSCR
eukprot:7142378-Karenia_brevis.AAC.1